MRWLALLLLAACRKDPVPVPDLVPVPVSAHAPVSVPVPASSAVRLDPAPADGDAASLIRTRRLQAKSEGRVLVIYVSATWCAPCTQFKKELASGRLDARLAKVTLLGFDADQDGERLVAAGYSWHAIPFVALPGPDGRPTDSIEAKGGSGSAWKELLGKLDTWGG